MDEEPSASVGGIRLANRVSGAPDPPPMLLLHALGEQAGSWAPVTAQFAAHYRVFALDMRGHGRSDWPGTCSSQLMRDDVVGPMEDLGLRDVTLVGHSMGGTVAYLTAIAKPERVSRLIVEDVPPPFPPETWEQLAAIAAPTLLIGGGPQSHIPQDLLADVAARSPSCELVTIPAGHYVHNTHPDQCAATVLRWLTS